MPTIELKDHVVAPSDAPSPTVSVVIPTYNQPALLRETVASVFVQTFEDYEVVLVDDGSTDQTPLVCSELQHRCGRRLRLISQPNGGIGAARNRGLDESRGKYIALLDHDDLWMPEKLAVQVAFMERHPECVASVVPFVHASGVELQRNGPAFDVSAVTDANGIVDRPLLRLSQNHGFMTTSSVLMFNRAAAGGLRYAERRGAVEDVPFYIKLMARGKFGIAGREALAVYREHAASGSSRPEYYFRGLQQLRAMDRAGEFSDFQGHQRSDLDAYLAYLGRLASMKQIMSGRRLDGIRLYRREFLQQLRHRRWKFLLSFPLLICLPLKLWGGRLPTAKHSTT